MPFADDSLIPIPFNNQTNNATKELDYLMISDIFTTSWQALTYSGFEPGDSVAVFGAGPVGLLAAYSALLRGASRVYSVDQVPDRLALAASIGAIPIQLNASDPVEQILAQDPNGVTRALDCVGFESVNATGQRDDGLIPPEPHLRCRRPRRHRHRRRLHRWTEQHQGCPQCRYGACRGSHFHLLPLE